MPKIGIIFIQSIQEAEAQYVNTQWLPQTPQYFLAFTWRECLLGEMQFHFSSSPWVFSCQPMTSTPQKNSALVCNKAKPVSDDWKTFFIMDHV